MIHAKAPSTGSAVGANGERDVLRGSTAGRRAFAVGWSADPTARRLARRFSIALIFAAAGSLVLAAAPAFAERTYESQLTGFSQPYAVASDGHDNVWVDDSGQMKEYEPFPSTGMISEHSVGGSDRSIALNNSTEYFYAANSGPVTVELFEIENAFAFKETWNTENSCGADSVAVDNSGGSTRGRVYVARSCSGPQHIQALKGQDEESPFSGSASYINGNKITSTPSGEIGNITDIATDTEGDFYVVDQSNNRVDEFNSEGIFVHAYTGAGGAGEPSFSSLSGVAVDPTNGHVLIVDSGNDVVDEFEPEGAYLGQITGKSPSEPFAGVTGGIAVNSSGYVYVGTGGGVVDIFAPAVKLPKVIYGAVSNPGHTSGTLNATAEPNGGGNIETCQFEYGTTTAYGTSVPCETSPPSSPPYSINTAVSAKISGLTAETTYHYRVIASNAKGTAKGADQTFTPHAVLELSTTAPPTNVGPGSATLTGTYTGDSNDTHYYFEYGTTTAYGQTSPAPPGADAGSGSARQEVSAEISGLTEYTIYHYRVVASNTFGTSYGLDQSFRSAPPFLPTIDSSSSSAVTESAATLSAQIRPGFGPTIYRFQYGTTASYGSQTYPGESIGSDNADHTASAEVSGLTPGTTYHFRAVATNFSGTTVGPDQILTTTDVPRVERTSSSNVTQTTVMLSAEVNPALSPTTYRFEYGSGTSYGSRTPESASVGSDDVGHLASAAISGLTPGTTYHFRAVATNAVGTTQGLDQTFTTIAKPMKEHPLEEPPIKCKKGFIKKHGKCVKRKPKHHKRSVRHA